MLSSLGWSTLSSIPKAAGMWLLLQILDSPGALAFRASHGLDDDPVCRVLLRNYFYGNWRAKVPNMLR